MDRRAGGPTEARRRVAFETPQLQLESSRQLTEGLHQSAVMEVRFRVVRVDRHTRQNAVIIEIASDDPLLTSDVSTARL